MNDSRDTAAHETPEFDAYSSNYAAGMDDPLKSMLGDSAEQFVEVKLRWLLRRHPALLDAATRSRFLDYGCGTATLLRLMAEHGARASLAGCDISRGMLEEAGRRWPESIQRLRPELRRQVGSKAPFPRASFDIVVISAVLHHVPPQERRGIFAELHRLTRPGGEIVVFEHNPLNPVTRYVVARTPIDRNAILLRAGEVCAGLAEAGATNIRTRYIMFMPPRWRALQRLEQVLEWVPLGAQYVVTATT